MITVEFYLLVKTDTMIVELHLWAVSAYPAGDDEDTHICSDCDKSVADSTEVVSDWLDDGGN